MKVVFCFLVPLLLHGALFGSNQLFDVVFCWGCWVTTVFVNSPFFTFVPRSWILLGEQNNLMFCSVTNIGCQSTRLLDNFPATAKPNKLVFRSSIRGGPLLDKWINCLYRGHICHSRHCRWQCKIFASGVNFSRKQHI